MEVVLLGTGASDAWPNPFCVCPSCNAARAAGIVRSQAAALVNREVLIECGGSVPAAAGHAGVDLSAVRLILVTHSHPDHWQPLVLLGRSWAAAPDPKAARPTLVAPPAVLAELGPWWLDVATVPARAGDDLTVEGYRIRPVAAAHGSPEIGPAVLFDLTAPDGGRMLWATDTGPLPPATLDALSGSRFDAVFLEETYGDGPAYGGNAHHHGLASFAATIGDLRERGAVTDDTRVCAVHLGHGNPPPTELEARLAAIGAHAPLDGERIEAGGRARRNGRRILVLGGARSGKSTYAERLLAAHPAVTYLATAPADPDDDEWRARVAAHQGRRPTAWRTVESVDVADELRAASADTAILVDCVALWLADRLDRVGAWAPDATHDAGADDLATAIDELVSAWTATAGQIVAVSNETGMGVVPATTSGRRYRDELGRLNQRLAESADEVWLLVAGQPVRLR